MIIPNPTDRRDGTIFSREVMMPISSWIERLLEELPGEIRETLLQDNELEGAEALEEVMAFLADHLSQEEFTEVMHACSCRYPAEKVAGAREAFLRNGSVTEAMDELRDQFMNALSVGMQLDGGIIRRILNSGWGLPGTLSGNTITVTKIPRSGNLRKYFSSHDPEERRTLYCHCAQVSGAISQDLPVPERFCECGAGFYRHIWEGILGRPVRVEIVETTAAGGHRCTFAIHLSDEGK